MFSYWPDGLEVSDFQSPNEILIDAQSEWESNSGGVLTLILQKGESKSGYDMTFVHAKHVPGNRTASLFSVVSRKGNPYPVRLQPKDDELPNFFKKSYRTQNLSHIASAVKLATEWQEEKEVQNRWVADTPGEFREKLEEVFNLGSIKSEILNLVSSDGEHPDADSKARKDDETDNEREFPNANEGTDEGQQIGEPD